MDRYYQALAGVLVALVLILTLKKQNGEIALLLSVLVCCMVGLLAFAFLEPVIRFFRKLQQLGSLDLGIFGILLKIVGICFTSEIAGVICEDAGNGALGKVLQLLASAVILYLSLPILTRLLELIDEILQYL